MIAVLSFDWFNIIKFDGFLSYLFLIALGVCFYWFYLRERHESIMTIVVLSHLLSIFMIVGHSYQTLGNWNLIFGNLSSFLYSTITYVGYYFLFSVILKEIFFRLDHPNVQQPSSNKFITYFNKHPFIISIVIMLLCWLPYIVAYYPSILSPDPSFQIKQFLGVPNKYSTYVVLIDPNVIITNHHPVLHTVLLGGFTKIGMMLGSTNLGLFMFQTFQTIILLLILAYSISYMNKQKIPIWIQIGALIFYCLNPIFPFYAMSAVKDVLFSSFVLLYMILLYDVIKNNIQSYRSPKKIIGSIVLMLLIVLLRNNGLYVILLSFPFLLFIKKLNRIIVLLILGSTLVLYFGYNDVLLPQLKITPGSIREVLSIPFQQTARYVKEHGNELTKDESRAIDKILGIDTLVTRYKPEISDPVKNKYNRYATKEDLKAYFKVWLHELIKHPDTYIQATLNNTYGYVYPGATKWYFYYKYYDIINVDGLNYHYNSLTGLRNTLYVYGVTIPYIPIIGLINRIGFNIWMVFIMMGYVIHIKKYKYLIYLLPAFISFLVCIASPVNTYFRYILPIAFGMPLMIGLLIDLKGEKKYEKE